jgi:hypothetical protein
MNRTKKLMTTVTTSLLLTGGVPGPSPLSSAFGQTVPKKDEAWKTDPEVGKAADQIGAWLKDKGILDAKSPDQIRKQFPDLSASMVDNAILLLRYQGRCLLRGDGTKVNPYTYYGLTATGGTG